MQEDSQPFAQSWSQAVIVYLQLGTEAQCTDLLCVWVPQVELPQNRQAAQKRKILVDAIKSLQMCQPSEGTQEIGEYASWRAALVASKGQGVEARQRGQHAEVLLSVTPKTRSVKTSYIGKEVQAAVRLQNRIVFSPNSQFLTSCMDQAHTVLPEAGTYLTAGTEKVSESHQLRSRPQQLQMAVDRIPPGFAYASTGRDVVRL